MSGCLGLGGRPHHWRRDAQGTEVSGCWRDHFYYLYIEISNNEHETVRVTALASICEGDACTGDAATETAGGVT